MECVEQKGSRGVQYSSNYRDVFGVYNVNEALYHKRLYTGSDCAGRDTPTLLSPTNKHVLSLSLNFSIYHMHLYQISEYPSPPDSNPNPNPNPFY